MNFLVIGFARLAIFLPSAPFWTGEESFNFVFGLAPRIALASLLAFLAGSFLNAYIMSKMKVACVPIIRSSPWTGIKSPKARGKNIRESALSPARVERMARNEKYFPWVALLKSLYEMIILPVTIGVVRYIKKIEKTDVYDTNVSYHPLKIKDI